MKPSYVVAFYKLDRACGGSEEGGWWYDTGQFVRVVATTPSEEHAYKIANRANDILDGQRRRKRKN